jgi:hypothetical protein
MDIEAIRKRVQIENCFDGPVDNIANLDGSEVDDFDQASKDRAALIKRVDELEQCTRLACNLYGHTNLENEYEGSTFLRCGVCGKNFDDQ